MIQDFHKQHKYYVSIHKIPTNLIGCIAHFPPNLILDMAEEQRTYILNPDTNEIELFIQQNNNIYSNTIQATIYNIRLLVLEDVFIQTYKRDMDYRLIILHEAKTLFKMLPIQRTKQEKQQETQLCVNFRNMLAGNVPTSNIDGYDQVVSCFVNGGLEL